MKKLIVAALFIPVFASAATVTLEDILDIVPNVGSAIGESLDLTGLFDVLDRGTGRNLPDTPSATTRNVSHEESIRQAMFPDTSGSSRAADVAEKIFGKQISKKKKIDCVSVTFEENFRLRASGEEVKDVQKFLNQNSRTRIAEEGIGSPGEETEYFGVLTVEAVKKFQVLFAKDILESVGLSEATGVWGPSTRKKANEITELCK